MFLESDSSCSQYTKWTLLPLVWILSILPARFEPLEPKQTILMTEQHSRLSDALWVCEQGCDDPLPQQEEVLADQPDEPISRHRSRIPLENG